MLLQLLMLTQRSIDMSKAIITESKLTAIADAIREKTGTADLMTVDEMATEITNLPTGGSGTGKYADAVINLGFTSTLTEE